MTNVHSRDGFSNSSGVDFRSGTIILLFITHGQRHELATSVSLENRRGMNFSLRGVQKSEAVIQKK